MALRIGLAGLGVHGLRYANHLLRGDVPGARLAAVCRRNERAGRAFADEHGLAWVAEPQELAASPAVDAVVLALPPDLHAAAATACIERDRPVLVEKPLASTLPEASSLAAEVERTGRFLMLAQTLRFDAVVRRLRELAPEVGELRAISVNQRFEPSERPWLDETGPGGILLNTGVHGFDLLRFLTGLEAESVLAECGRAVTRRTDDQFAALIRLEPGKVLAVVENSRSTLARSGRMEIVGEYGQLWGDHIHRTLVSVRGRQAVDLGPVPDRPTLPAALESFVRCVEDGTEPEVGAEDGLATLELVEGASRSAKLGRRVPLAELRSG